MKKQPGVTAWVATCAFPLLTGCVGTAAPPAPPSPMDHAPWIHQPTLAFAPTLTTTPAATASAAPPAWLAAALDPAWRRTSSQEPGSAPAPESAASDHSSAPAGVDKGIVSSPPADAPFSLTSSDGTGLRLVELRARAFVAAPLALTELQLTFENPESRLLEGRFRLVLPQHAAISRFAMAVGSHWQEGEVLERQRGRETFEDFLHRAQDPALLEQAAGNEFAARVFPIPVRGKKRLVVSYSEELQGNAPYRLRLRGLPRIDELDAEVHVLGRAGAVAHVQRSSVVPDGDLVVPRAELGDQSGLRGGRHVVLRVQPDVTDAPQPLDRVAVLVDTSASRALGFAQQLAMVRHMAGIAGDGDGHRLLVACFDQEVQIAYDGPPRGFGERQLETIEQREALGASDLHGALRWIARQVAPRGITRLVLLTDAVATVGGSGEDPMASTVHELRAAGLERLDVVAFGGIRDDAGARHLASSQPEAGIVIDGSEPAWLIAKRLTQTTHSGLPVQVENAVSVWPRHLDGIQAGDEVIVHVELPGAGSVKLAIGGRPVAVGAVLDADPQLVARSWARARIGALLDQERHQGRSPELRDQIVELSTKHRVLSPYTAFLVLETEADYERFEIRRDALADILTVTESGVGVANRSTAPDTKKSGGTSAWSELVVPAAPTSAPPVEMPEPSDTVSSVADAEATEDDAAAALETVPRTRGAEDAVDPSSSGAGAVVRAHRVRAPRVRMGATKVSGRLPPEVIQHIVRQNFGRFRACYHRGLLRDPHLGGRVASRFVIGRDGVVANVSITASDLGDSDVESCVAEAFYAIGFPKPEGGIVTVEYPLVFHLDGEVPRLSARVEPPPADPEACAEARELPGCDPESDEADLAAGQVESPEQASDPEVDDEPSAPEPWTGRFAEIMASIEAGRNNEALAKAQAWHEAEPGDLLALVALGRAHAKRGNLQRAARAYGSLLDLYSFRADVRRFAAAELEALGQDAAQELALDSYRHAVAQRPDHASGHRLLAMALLRERRYSEAFDALVDGRSRAYPVGRFSDIKRILGEDLALVVAAWSRAEPWQATMLKQRLERLGIEPESKPSLRFVLTWETDSNDVDLHVYDDAGHHAFYSEPDLPAAGGSLYADVTNGYGPEVFTVRQPQRARASEYRILAHYYSRGPMGYGLGKLQVVDHDGLGHLVFQDHPFVIMSDHAKVELGIVRH